MDIHSKKHLRKHTQKYTWAGFTCLLVLLAVFFPLSGDDWQWGVHSGWTTTLNGRYLGNFFAILLTGNAWLRPVVVGGAMAFIIYAVSRLAGQGQASGRGQSGGQAQSGEQLLLCAAAVIFLPREIFRQVFPWVSGFSNFAMPVVILLAIALLYKYSRKARFYPLIFALAFAAQLFAEHITVANLVFAVGLVIYLRAVRGRWDMGLVWAGVGFAAGAVMMFSHAAYTSAGAGGAHAMPTGTAEMLRNAQINFVNELTPSLFSAHLQLLLPVCVLCIALISLHGGEKSAAGRLIFTRGLKLYFMLFAAWGVVRLLSGNVLWNLQAFRRVEGLMAAGFMLALGTAVFFYVTDKARRERVLLGWFALIALNAPLMPVNPIGPRCFFISYIVLLWMALELLAHVQERGMFASFTQKARPALLCAVAGMIALLFVVYGVTFQNYRERDAALRDALEQGASAVYVRMLTFPSFVWTGEPTDEYFQIIYRRFHGIPPEMELYFQR